MKEEQLKRILGELAEQAAPADLDLWPAIQSRFETNQTHTQPGESSMNAHIARRWQARFAAAALLIALLAAALLVTPQGRAWAQSAAQSALQFFTRSEGNTRLIPTQDLASLVEVTLALEEETLTSAATPWPTATPRPESLQAFHDACGNLPYPHCTLEQVSQMVAFPVKGFAEMPEGLEFVGASGSPEAVTLMYQGLSGTLYLAQSPASQDNLQDWQIAADALVEALPIGNLPGEYVQGGWMGLGIAQAGTLPWETGSGLQTLRWQQDGIRYTLWCYAHKVGDSLALDKARLVELAAKLTTKPPKAQAPGQAAFLALDQAATRAGFSAVEPAWLPAGYMLAGATYAPERNAICLHYRYRLEATAPTLTIYESYGWLPTVQEIKVQQFYNGQEIEIPTSIESLLVAGAENGYATLASNGVNLGPICGGIEMTTNKALLWRAKNMNFILGTVVDQFQGRGFLTNLEMQRVAESLTGVSTIAAEIIDPERLTSIETLKSLAKFEVKAPTRMLAGLHFDHASYLGAGNQANPYYDYRESERALLIYLGAPLGDGSDGRFYYLFISQVSGPEIPTLEELALAGGYESASVNGQPAIQRQDCWVGPAPGGAACMQTITWLENGVWYEIDVFLEKALPKELLIAIAESLQ
ncbi:MAG: hypothetical protein JXA78_07945 [Anaerolineales bacterium]|nr:hypothetical protein [Anaerolineales bacterium]